MSISKHLMPLFFSRRNSVNSNNSSQCKSSTNLAVSVIGCSGTAAKKCLCNDGVGKSSLCSRFMAVIEDEFSNYHPSEFSEEDFYSRVVNREHWLYWGSRVFSWKKTSNSTSVDSSIVLHVIEHTEFSLDLTGEQMTSRGTEHQSEHYNTRCLQTHLSCVGKRVYRNFQQLHVDDCNYSGTKCNQRDIDVHGVIFIYDVSPFVSHTLSPAAAHTWQISSLLEIISALSIRKKPLPVVIGLSKVDTLWNHGKESFEMILQNIVDCIVQSLQQLQLSKYCPVALVAFSAVENVNVETVFEELIDMMTSASHDYKLVRMRTRSRWICSSYQQSKERRDVFHEVALQEMMKLFKSEFSCKNPCKTNEQDIRELFMQEEWKVFTDLFGIEFCIESWEHLLSLNERESELESESQLLKYFAQIMEHLVPHTRPDLYHADIHDILLDLQDRPDFEEFFFKRTNTNEESNENCMIHGMRIPWEWLYPPHSYDSRQEAFYLIIQQRLICLRQEEENQMAEELFREFLWENTFPRGLCLRPGLSLQNARLPIMNCLNQSIVNTHSRDLLVSDPRWHSFQHIPRTHIKHIYDDFQIELEAQCLQNFYSFLLENLDVLKDIFSHVNVPEDGKCVTLDRNIQSVMANENTYLGLELVPERRRELLHWLGCVVSPGRSVQSGLATHFPCPWRHYCIDKGMPALLNATFRKWLLHRKDTQRTSEMLKPSSAPPVSHHNFTDSSHGVSLIPELTLVVWSVNMTVVTEWKRAFQCLCPSGRFFQEVKGLSMNQCLQGIRVKVVYCNGVQVVADILNQHRCHCGVKGYHFVILLLLYSKLDEVESLLNEWCSSPLAYYEGNMSKLLTHSSILMRVCTDGERCSMSNGLLQECPYLLSSLKRAFNEEISLWEADMELESHTSNVKVLRELFLHFMSEISCRLGRARGDGHHVSSAGCSSSTMLQLSSIQIHIVLTCPLGAENQEWANHLKLLLDGFFTLLSHSQCGLCLQEEVQCHGNTLSLPWCPPISNEFQCSNTSLAMNYKSMLQLRFRSYHAVMSDCRRKQYADGYIFMHWNAKNCDRKVVDFVAEHLLQPDCSKLLLPCKPIHGDVETSVAFTSPGFVEGRVESLADLLQNFLQRLWNKTHLNCPISLRRGIKFSKKPLNAPPSLATSLKQITQTTSENGPLSPLENSSPSSMPNSPSTHLDSEDSASGVLHDNNGEFHEVGSEFKFVKSDGSFYESICLSKLEGGPDELYHQTMTRKKQDSFHGRVNGDCDEKEEEVSSSTCMSFVSHRKTIGCNKKQFRSFGEGCSNDNAAVELCSPCVASTLVDGMSASTKVDIDLIYSVPLDAMNTTTDQISISKTVKEGYETYAQPAPTHATHLRGHDKLDEVLPSIQVDFDCLPKPFYISVAVPTSSPIEAPCQAYFMDGDRQRCFSAPTGHEAIHSFENHFPPEMPCSARPLQQAETSCVFHANDMMSENYPVVFDSFPSPIGGTSSHAKSLKSRFFTFKQRNKVLNKRASSESPNSPRSQLTQLSHVIHDETSNGSHSLSPTSPLSRPHSLKQTNKPTSRRPSFFSPSKSKFNEFTTNSPDHFKAERRENSSSSSSGQGSGLERNLFHLQQYFKGKKKLSKAEMDSSGLPIQRFFAEDCDDSLPLDSSKHILHCKDPSSSSTLKARKVHIESESLDDPMTESSHEAATVSAGNHFSSTFSKLRSFPRFLFSSTSKVKNGIHHNRRFSLPFPVKTISPVTSKSSTPRSSLQHQDHFIEKFSRVTLSKEECEMTTGLKTSKNYLRRRSFPLGYPGT